MDYVKLYINKYVSNLGKNVQLNKNSLTSEHSHYSSGLYYKFNNIELTPDNLNQRLFSNLQLYKQDVDQELSRYEKFFDEEGNLIPG